MADDLGRRLVEVPVGFKWFVDGLLDGTLGFGGEESAGASFLRRDGAAWSTDKDGLIPCLLAAEMTAQDRQRPGRDLRRAGRAVRRTPSTGASTSPPRPRRRTCSSSSRPSRCESSELAGEPILDKLTSAPGNGAPIGGLKVVAEHGWFAARPSGTEDVYKVYAESLDGEERLERILDEARDIVKQALRR